MAKLRQTRHLLFNFAKEKQPLNPEKKHNRHYEKHQVSHLYSVNGNHRYRHEGMSPKFRYSK